MNLTILLSAIVITFFVFALCYMFSRPASKLYIPDSPTHRSMHSVPVSRAGGVAIIIPIIFSWIITILFFEVNINLVGVLAGLFILILISYLDDIWTLAPLWRLLVHITAAFILVNLGFSMLAVETGIDSNIFYVLLIELAVVLLIVWSINLYNFMDGIDGLAGGMGVIGFSCMAWHGWFVGNYTYMGLAVVVTAANFGFLLLNFPPARIFMGDTGSISMGYAAAFFSIWGFFDDIFAWWVPVLIFSPFLVDSTITLLLRFLKGDKVWEAHRSHYYQKLVFFGWSHRKTVISEYILMIIAAGTTICSNFFGTKGMELYVLMTWVVVYIVLILVIDSIPRDKGNQN